MNQLKLDKVKAAMVEMTEACDAHGNLVYSVRNVLESFEGTKREKGLALLQYIMVYLRVAKLSEDDIYLNSAAAIARAFSVPLEDCEEPFEEEDCTPTYPAEQGELN